MFLHVYCPKADGYSIANRKTSFGPQGGGTSFLLSHHHRVDPTTTAASWRLTISLQTMVDHSSKDGDSVSRPLQSRKLARASLLSLVLGVGIQAQM